MRLFNFYIETGGKARLDYFGNAKDPGTVLTSTTSSNWIKPNPQSHIGGLLIEGGVPKQPVPALMSGHQNGDFDGSQFTVAASSSVQYVGESYGNSNLTPNYEFLVVAEGKYFNIPHVTGST